MQILKGNTSCESYDCDEIHISSKNFIVQSEDTKMCDLMLSEACGPSTLNVIYIERERESVKLIVWFNNICETLNV